MSFDVERLYDLLPAVHRIRDEAQGQPLKQLLAVIAGQTRVLEENLEQLYDNHFVETAAPWALPYLADLLGVRGLPGASMATTPRAEVGHTLAYRRRKGTAAMLELLARDITGRPAAAVEYFERLAATQHLNHLRPQCRSFASLRKATDLEFVGTPFETQMRTAEVRRIEPGRGKWNIPNVGLHLWRIGAFSRTGSPLVPAGELWPGDPFHDRRFRCHPFDLDAPLFFSPATEDDVAKTVEPQNVPLPLTQRQLVSEAGSGLIRPALYGPESSLWLEQFMDGSYAMIPGESVIVCDLSDTHDAANNLVWNHQNRAAPGQAAVDPRLGRIVLGSSPLIENHPPRVSFHYGFSFQLGGGEYPRPESVAAAGTAVVRIPTGSATPETGTGPVTSADTLAGALIHCGSLGGRIEVADSGRYVELLPDAAANGAALQIRALSGSCPVVGLRPNAAGQPWTIRGDHDGSVVLDGLWLAGALRVAGDLGHFAMRHCTLAPGRGVDAVGRIVAAPGITLEITSRRTQVSIENCILPPLRVGTDGLSFRLRNCLIDAGSVNQFALSDATGNGPAGSWRIENCTIIGKVAVDVLELASNCIFLSESVFVRRRQEGCVRFSWLPHHPSTRTPRRHHCLPAEHGEQADVSPQFTSLRYGDAAYGQLSQRCPDAIRRGADDGAELGAYHDLFQPQRKAHLRARLDEYLRFGLEAGIFCES